MAIVDVKTTYTCQRRIAGFHQQHQINHQTLHNRGNYNPWTAAARCRFAPSSLLLSIDFYSVHGKE
jgi:hypothetical protein